MRINRNLMEEQGFDVEDDGVNITSTPMRGHDISGEVAQMFRSLNLDPHDDVVAAAMDSVMEKLHDTSVLVALMRSSESRH